MGGANYVVLDLYVCLSVHALSYLKTQGWTALDFSVACGHGFVGRRLCTASCILPVGPYTAYRPSLYSRGWQLYLQPFLRYGWGPQTLKRVTWRNHDFQGWFVVRRLGLATINLYTKCVKKIYCSAVLCYASTVYAVCVHLSFSRSEG